MDTTEEFILTFRLLGTRTSSAIGKDRERLLALHLHYWVESQLYFLHFIGVCPVESQSH